MIGLRKGNIKKMTTIIFILVLLFSHIVIMTTIPPAQAAEQLIDFNEVDGGKQGVRVYSGFNQAQCFYATGNYNLTKVSLFIKDIGLDDDMIVYIYSNDDSGTPGDPNDDVPLAPYSSQASGNGPDNIFAWVNFTFSNLQLTAGTRYWIVASNAETQNNGYRLQDSDGDAYPNGYTVNDGLPSWVIDLTNDLMFRLYGETNIDVGVQKIIAPEHLEIFDEGNFTAVIKNYGSLSQGSFDVNIVVKDPYGIDVLNTTQNVASLAFDATTNISWLFTPLMEGTYTIIVTTLLTGDEYGANNASVGSLKTIARPVLKLHDDITIDGSINDWNAVSLPVENTWNTSYREYIWQDAQGDPRGDGNYVYPNNPRYEGGSLDLREFRVAVDSDNINFLLIFQSIDDGSGDGTDGPYGFSEQIIEILIDTNRNGTGRQDTIRNARLKIDDDLGWEYALWADGWGNGYLEDDQGNVFTTVSARGSPVSNAVEISIPASGDLIPDFEVWRYIVLIGAQDDLSLPDPIEGSRSGFLKVDATDSPSGGGGGIDLNGADPNVYDMAFANPQADQLNNYGLTDISFASYTDITTPQDANVDINESWAQSFSAPFTNLISQVDIYARDIGANSPGTFNIMIQSNDDKGTPSPLDDEPSGVNISSPEAVDFAATFEWISIPFSNPPVIREGETYWIVATCSDSDGNGYAWGQKPTDPWPGGTSSRYLGGSWTLQTEDMIFNLYYRKLSSADAYQAIHFAPIMINELNVNTTYDLEWINLVYSGTDNAPDLDMNNWILTDQDGNDFSFGNFILLNKFAVTIHTGSGINTSTDLFWNLPFKVWDDQGEDASLYSDIFIPIDYMNYTDGVVFGDSPPPSVKWNPESTEGLPRNPTNEQTISLNEIGGDNDLFSDWGLKATGLVEEKTFYLHDDGSLDSDDPYDLMNTTPPWTLTVSDFDTDINPGLTLKKNLNPNPLQNYQEFNLTPALASDFNIADDVVVDLWMDNNAGGSIEVIDVKLFDSDGITKIEIASKTQTSLFDSLPGWEMISFTIPDVIYTIPKDHFLVLKIAANTSTPHNLWLAYNSSIAPSRIRVVPTRTFVNVSWARTFDILDVEKSNFVLNEEVLLRANVSDPLGSYDIAGCNITIISPGGFTYYNDVPMNLNATDPSDPSAWKLYDFTFLDTNESGIYTVIIKGIESNGVIHLLTINFTAIGGVPPQLLLPMVTPFSGDITTSFNFSVQYIDLDDNPPQDIFVVINGLGTFNLTEVDPGDTNYTNGKTYYVNLTGFVNGTNYSYYFRTRDTSGLWNLTATIPGPIVQNTPPVLFNMGFTPPIGKATTDFNFTVTYLDIDNHPPDSIFVNISGPSHTGSWAMMEVDPLDTDYTDGKLYYYNYTGFFNGSYTHHFAANDSMGSWTETIELPGPLVEKTPLQLFFVGVSPILGYITTEFNYTVTYVNLDNIAADNVYVNITGPSHAGSWLMLEVDPSDTTYFDGKEYYYVYTGFIIGNYTFHCAAESQNNWNETIEINAPDILNSPPVLQNYDLDPLVGFAGVTVFNYTVTYYDADNQAPINFTLNITGPFSNEYTMMELDPADTDYTDGKDYYFELTLPLDGLYTYRIEAEDSGGAWAIPVTDTGPGIGGNKPILSQPSVTPEIGITTTWFNFTVRFADLQNDSVGVIKLNLSGPANLMIPLMEVDPSDTNTSNGKMFFVNISGLLKGQYTFNFEGNDSLGNFTVSQNRTGPLVQNSPPQLSGSFFNESNMGGTWVNFTLLYTDFDNDTISDLSVNITGIGNFALNELLVSDTNLTDGKEFYLNITLPKGNHMFRFEVQDSGFQSTWNYTAFDWINLSNNIPILTEDVVTPSSGFGGDMFNFTVNITDYDDDSLFVWLYLFGDFSGIYPMMELDAFDVVTSDGKYYYFNLQLDKGSYSFYFWVSDGSISNQSSPIILIVNNNPPVINTTDVVSTFEDTLYSVDYNFTDSDLDTVLWNLSTNATWLSIDPITGLLFGTSTNSDVGSYWVNVSVDDGDGGVDSHNFSLVVINVPPSFTTSPSISIEENQPFVDNFNCDDDSQGTITYSLISNATWLSINPATGVLSGTPTSAEIGWYWVNVSVSDGNGGMDYINYSINVTNKIPIIITIPIRIAMEDSLHIDDFNSDDDIPGVTVYSLNTNASWLSISPITGILSGIPDNTLVGWYWVNVTVDDGSGGVGYLNYSLNVTNKPPTITTVPITNVDEDDPHIMDFNCDDDGQGIIIYSLLTNATWLSINPSTGVLSGNPDNSHVGMYWINVSVSDGNGGIDYINYNFTVNNLIPTITTTPVGSVLEDTEYLIDFNCVDDGQGTITYVLSTNASWLVIDPATGVVNGTANNSLVGSYWVNVTVLDGKGGLDFKNFSLEVINAEPTITTTPATNAFEDVYFEQDFDSIDDGQGAITYSLTTDALWLSMDPVNGTIWGTPLDSDIGSYWVNITVNDGVGGTHSLNYSLFVLNTNDPPVIVTSNVGAAIEDSLYSVDYDHTDLDSDSVTWSLTTDAGWLDINPGTGVLSGTPGNSDVGSYFVNITASDGNGGFDYTEFSLVVSNTNDAPSIPSLLFPSDDSTINLTLFTFSWSVSVDPDVGDTISFYNLQYSSSSDFSQNVTNITGILGTSYQIAVELEDKSTYYWRVEAFDLALVGSGYQSPHFVFEIQTGYLPPTYNGRLKSDMVKNGKTWQVDLDEFFSPQTITDGLVFSSSHPEIEIDPVTHVASWKPRNKDSQLTDVTFTVSDGVTNITSQPIDLSVEKEVTPMTFWERILWPYPLLSLIVVFIIVGVLTYRKIIYAPKVERVFLIHEHSILITHQSVGKNHELDEDILSGMLAGVKNLISDAFGGGQEGEVQEDLRKLEFGDRNILLERGNHFFIAVVFTGRANKDLASRIKGVINEIEERFTDELKGWEGYTDAFEGIDEIIATLLPKDQVVEEEEELKEEVYVEVPDEDEFYKGDEEEVYDEEVYEDQIIKEVPKKKPQEDLVKDLYKDIPDDVIIIPEEIPQKETDEKPEFDFPEKEKKILDDELDVVLKDYMDDSVPEEPKVSHFPPPPPMDVSEKTKKGILPSLVPFKSKEDKKILSEEQKSSLPPPPWLEKKTKVETPSEPELLKELEEKPKETPSIPIEEEFIEEETEKEPPMPLKEEVIEDRVPPIMPIEEEPQIEPPDGEEPEPQVEEKSPFEPLVEEEIQVEPPVEEPQIKPPIGEVVEEGPEPLVEEIVEEEPLVKPPVEEKPKMTPPPPPPEPVVEEEYEYECPECGSGISSDMTSCPSCGAEFKFEEEEAAEDLEYECPSCGAPVSADMNKCPSCGVHFASD
jgi:hypothetical protein